MDSAQSTRFDSQPGNCHTMGERRTSSMAFPSALVLRPWARSQLAADDVEQASAPISFALLTRSDPSDVQIPARSDTSYTWQPVRRTKSSKF